MSQSLFGIFLLVISTGFTCNNNASINHAKKPVLLHKKGFAIVELFTSEGCSSCPPAEVLAAAIAANAEKDSTDIFVLSEHVDYWNRLGWYDANSSPFFSQRQGWYEEYFKGGSVYTPQMIINGHYSFVGSDGAQAKKVLDEVLNNSNDSVRIRLWVDEQKNGSYRYELDKNYKGCNLNFALVEKKVVAAITKGENAGRTLTHTDVVRDWVAISDPAAVGEIEFKKMPHPDKNKFTLIAFVQKQDSRGIILAGAYK